MDITKQFIETQVVQWFAQQNFTEDTISTKAITEGLSKLIGQTPTIKVLYKKEDIINESTNEVITLEQLDYLEIYYISKEPIWNGVNMSSPEVSIIKIEI